MRALPRIVLDTNVLVSALRSRRGASFALLERIGKGWVPLISVPLILEYEGVGKRDADPATVDAIVQAFCHWGHETAVHFRLGPILPDPADEFLLDLAAAGAADGIVTHNVRHFGAARQFGVQVMTPREFLRTIES